MSSGHYYILISSCHQITRSSGIWQNLRVLEKDDEGVDGISSVASSLFPGGRSKIQGFVAEWYSGSTLSFSSQSSKLGFLRMWGESRMEEREGMLDWRQWLLRLLRCCSR